MRTTMNYNPLNCIDFYKSGHVYQYPKGTTEVYSNLTARSSKNCKIKNVDKVVFFGLQYFLKHFLDEIWGDNFFKKDINAICDEYIRLMDSSLGNGKVGIEHIVKLHDLGYLPLSIKALPEGSLVPIKVPMMIIKNTHPDFYWLTNYIETALSCYCWKPITTATIAYEYSKLLKKYAKKTCDNDEFVKYQAHDFSMRGMSCIQDACVSSAGHLLSFCGTDTVPSIDFIKKYYKTYETFAFSVPATEHSVMCMGGKDGEFETIDRLITETYSHGVISIVSDTWDLWRVLKEYLPKLKDKILNRSGKVVIRPDSGNPIDIICGTDETDGVIKLLWDIFGGHINKKGYKVLNDKIGCIYGDSITYEIAKKILKKLKLLGFASENIFFGIGSYTYEYVTRDTFGMAIKATSGVVNGDRIDIFKDPITDSGTKKSAKGLLRVEKIKGEYVLFDCQSVEQENLGELKEVYRDGKLLKDFKFNDIAYNLYKSKVNI